ncbi:hydroxymethylbilane synthase [Luteolibacter sp. GHJ8]|uniref:Porphobilinogen deaminase n=1 Tax=Luteolibacter rhizosphaerae TaxID=2989719 RepID=A0ABT3G8P9_9BACT|nr:hydroxymethylbilane synthase [Luteolibacter rhizosphaerae]MCW1916223.1 hydroxymethylbilane synthase [Luteolibacter rhizosphaerae]
MSEEIQHTTIGTRGSDLALVQSAAVERALSLAFPELRLSRRVIRTTGDRRTDVALAQVAKAEGTDKGIFTKELEEALKAGEIDIAVHSLKDVPTVLDDGFEIAGVLTRAPIRDVLVTKTLGGLEGLPAGSVVGTSSVRRAKQLEWLRPDLRVVDLRGNVPTRLKKLADSVCDALLLAEAGLVRLGYRMSKPAIVFGSTLNFTPLKEDSFYPAAGQGAIGLEIRKGDAAAAALVGSIRDADTFARVRAEREFLRLLEGGCSTPVGVYTTYDGGTLKMDARVFPDQGGEPKKGSASGSDPLAVAAELFHSLA